MLNKESFNNANLELSGLKIALVVSNQDPKTQERILVRVIGVHNLSNTSEDNAVWAHHCAPFRGVSGDLPETGDYVYVLFPNRTDPLNIIWLGFVRSSYQDGIDGIDDTVKPIHKNIGSYK